MIFMSIFKKQYILPFSAGIAAAVVVKRVLKSETVHRAVVKTVAKGLAIKDEAQAAVNTIKEQSQDLYAEAVAEKARAAKAVYEAETEAVRSEPAEAEQA